MHPFTGATGGCAPPEQENKSGKKRREVQEMGPRRREA